MKKMLKDAADSGLLMVLAVAGIYCAAIFLAGCTSAPRAKDVNLRGLYANPASETVAIGSAKITLLPDSIDSFIAHYAEDTVWLNSSVKTHSLDIYMTGTNSTSSAQGVINAVCKAFAAAQQPADPARENK